MFSSARRQKWLLTFGVLTFATTLVGCAKTTVVLWTDRADVAPVVEMFNVYQGKYVMELRYDPDMNRELRLEDTQADVVIAESIEDQTTAQLFRSLERILARELDRDDFYLPLLENGERGGRQMLLPLSFNLPLVFFADAAIDEAEDIILSPDDMRFRGMGFNEIADGEATRIAFSPLWDASFLYELVRLEGFTVRESAAGEPEWSLDSLLSGLNLAQEWIDSDNGGFDVDESFRLQYLYDPVIRLVQQGRVLFGFDDSSSFLRRSDLARRGLQFKWFGSAESVRVLESILYVGIPDAAKNRAAAEDFVSWLFRPETQELMLQNNRQKRVDSFGIAGGFSSLWRITERHIPLQYPELESMVPPARWLVFPPPSPRHWKSAISPVVEPWLLREVSSQSQSRDLSSSVRSWLLQQED